MWAVEVGIWKLFVLSAIVLTSVVPIFPTSLGTADPQVVSTANSIYDQMNYGMVQNQTDAVSTGIAAVDYVVIAAQWAWWGVLWLVMILSLAFACGPALIILFGINTALAAFLTVGDVVVWLIAVIQFKTGKSLKLME